MALSVTHPFVSAIADGADATLVRPSNWNAAHTLAGVASAAQGGTGIAYFAVAGPTVERIYTFPDSAATILYSGGALGTPSSGTLTNATGLPEAGLTLADNTTNNVSITAHGFAPKAPNVATQYLDGTGAYSTPAGGASLDGITAATADQAGIANADWNVRWNWAKTTNSEVGFEIGESAASTGGTSTSGVPNQVITKLSTVAASTASPLQVYARAVHAFSVSPTATPQILARSGATATPTYSFAADTDSGVYLNGDGNLALVAANVIVAALHDGIFFPRYIQIDAATTANALGITDATNANSGLYWPASNTLAISTGALKNSDFGGASGTNTLNHYNAGAVTTSYGHNFYKSRGSVASPTVITTGDDLATVSGFGYVGATGTYVEGCRITFDSTGTIANTTSGLGGIMRLACAAVGTVAPAEILRLTRATTTGGGWATLNEADASPGTGDLADGDEMAVYCKAGNVVFAMNVGGAMKFLYCPIDGVTVLFTADGTGP